MDAFTNNKILFGKLQQKGMREVGCSRVKITRNHKKCT